jgi:hypothetical protein
MNDYKNWRSWRRMWLYLLGIKGRLLNCRANHRDFGTGGTAFATLGYPHIGKTAISFAMLRNKTAHDWQRQCHLPYDLPYQRNKSFFLSSTSISNDIIIRSRRFISTVPRSIRVLIFKN